MPAEPMIGILQMEMGNLRSAYNAVYECGFDPIYVDAPSRLDDLTHLVVPGDGNFRAVMEHLDQLGFSGPIKAFAQSGRPLLGICSGMQLLADYGVESGDTPGLGLIHGTVRRLPDDRLLPHVGWSEVELRFDHPVTSGIKPARDFYFVHSYAIQDGAPDEVLGEAEYGARFAAMVARGNIVGFQFHPEKSQANGLRLIENFCHWDGRC